MQITKSLVFSILLVVCAVPGARSADYRTDLNPASLYYQAFLMAPELDPADRDLLWTNWRGLKLPDRYGEIVARYDGQLALVRRAARCTVACDWGIDMSPGLATLLPHLARAKAVTQNARFHAAWALQQGRSNDACDDLLAALALGRNISRDGTLISVLVQIAIEALVCNPVAENFHKFPPETLQRFIAGLDAAPAPGTITACLPTEKAFFHDWTLRKIADLQQQNPGNDAKVMADVRQLLRSLADQDQNETDFWKRLTEASGGTSAGVLKLLREREAFYERLAALSSLPYRDYERQLNEFTAQVEKSPNPFIRTGLTGIAKAHSREFRSQVELAMLRAAVEYKLRGEAGLKSVADPCGNGSFGFQRFVFESVDRGFELRSVFDAGGFQFVLIFVEKDGPPFFVDGPKAGQAVKFESDQETFRRRYGLEPAKK